MGARRVNSVKNLNKVHSLSRRRAWGWTGAHPLSRIARGDLVLGGSAAVDGAGDVAEVVTVAGAAQVGRRRGVVHRAHRDGRGGAAVLGVIQTVRGDTHRGSPSA